MGIANLKSVGNGLPTVISLANEMHLLLVYFNDIIFSKISYFFLFHKNMLPQKIYCVMLVSAA